MVDNKLKGWVMTFEKFNQVFEINMTKVPTYTEAYNITEDLHEKETGQRRYSDYNSFRVVRTKKIK